MTIMLFICKRESIKVYLWGSVGVEVDESGDAMRLQKLGLCHLSQSLAVTAKDFVRHNQEIKNVQNKCHPSTERWHQTTTEANPHAEKILRPYPSSLKFTAHSSISPKTSKRRFNSVRVQSDLSRPTYTTRLSSCSLRGKTEPGKEIKRGESFFPFTLLFLHHALMNWSWSLLWILPLTLGLLLLSVCVPMWLVQLPSSYLMELHFESAFNLPWHYNSSFSLQHINQKQRDFYQMMPCLKFGAASSSVKFKNKAVRGFCFISEKCSFFPAMELQLTENLVAKWEVC